MSLTRDQEITARMDFEDLSFEGIQMLVVLYVVLIKQ